MTEVWTPVVGFEGAYEVSDLGRVRSLDRVIQRVTGPARYKGRILRPAVRKKTRYCSVMLSMAGEQSSFLVHDLVAQAFIGPRPPRAWVAHNDGDPSRNGAKDIRYDTPSANHMDKLAHGTLQHGEKHHNATLTADDVAAIRASAARNVDLADRYGVGPNEIYRIKARKRWRHVA